MPMVFALRTTTKLQKQLHSLVSPLPLSLSSLYSIHFLILPFHHTECSIPFLHQSLYSFPFPLSFFLFLFWVPSKIPYPLIPRFLGFGIPRKLFFFWVCLMGVKSRWAGKGMEGCELLNENGKNGGRAKKRNRRSNRQRNQPLIQTLFGTCKEVFANAGAGFVPRPDDVERLTSVLDSLKPADVSLTPKMPYFRSTNTKGAPPITYLHLYECDKFSMGIFCLPESAVIPLHNHPGMTVFSKLLFGTMHIKSYDWTAESVQSTTSVKGPLPIQGEVSQLAKLQTNAEFSAPCNTFILYPAAGGNMHCFTAITACAVLDVLGPPYSDADGRHCTYYIEHPFDSFTVDERKVPENKKENYAWLQEIEKPDDLVVQGASYAGPRISEA